MKKLYLLSLMFVLTFSFIGKAQKVDSIFFNLYTDSLKKGTHNYINVDGKLSDGRWLPLTGKELTFTSTAGKFENNSLVLDKDFKEEKVTVKAVLKSDTTVWKCVTIYIKKHETFEKLKTAEEVFNELEQQGRQRQRKKNK